MCGSASKPITGTCSGSPTATTSTAIEAAIEAAQAETGRPSLIAVRTVIGYGSPRAGTNKVHGEAMGPDDTAATKKYFGFPEDSELLRSRRCAQELAQSHRSRKGPGSGVEEALRRVRRAVSRARGAIQADGGEQAEARMGEVSAVDVPCRQARGHAQRRQCGDERDCRRGAGIVWRRGGLDVIDQDDTQEQPAFRREPRGPQHGVLRRARVWHVRGREWHGGALKAWCPTAQRSSRFPITPSRLFARPRSRRRIRSSSSPTTRSAWAKTAPPTSPSST